MIREAGVRDVLERIVRKVRDSDLAKTLARKVMRYLKTKNDRDDLTSKEQAWLYRDVDHGQTLPLSKKRNLDLDWTGHAEYRSELRDIDPRTVNETVRDRLFNVLRDPKKKNRGTVRYKEPGVGTMVVDYDVGRKPADADVVSVWASDRMASVMGRVEAEIVRRSLRDPVVRLTGKKEVAAADLLVRKGFARRLDGGLDQKTEQSGRGRGRGFRTVSSPWVEIEVTDEGRDALVELEGDPRLLVNNDPGDAIAALPKLMSRWMAKNDFKAKIISGSLVLDSDKFHAVVHEPEGMRARYEFKSLSTGRSSSWWVEPKGREPTLKTFANAVQKVLDNEMEVSLIARTAGEMIDRARDIDRPTMWYENQDGDQLSSEESDGPDGADRTGYSYQHSRFPYQLNHTILKGIDDDEVAACDHDEQAPTYGWMPGIEGRECKRCGGTQTKNASEEWPEKWEADGCKNLMTMTSTWSEDLVLGLVNEGFGLGDAIVASATSCERCMNAMAHEVGLDWGYPVGSEDWVKCGTSCELCDGMDDKRTAGNMLDRTSALIGTMRSPLRSRAALVDRVALRVMGSAIHGG